MVFCGQCGTQLGPNPAKFCSSCGFQLQRATPSSSTSAPVSSTSSETTSVGTGRHAVSDAYLPGNIGTGGSIDDGLAKAFGLGNQKQRTMYETETKGSSPVVGTCRGCGSRVQGANINALGSVWHQNCFKCNGCGEIFAQTGNNRVLERDNVPWCEGCFDKKYSEACGGCGQTVGGSVVKAMGRSWHADCFRCTRCNTKFAGGSIINKAGKPYCKNCSTL